MKIAFYTLGCKVNQYETQILVSSFKSNGFEVVSSDETADIYIINSCTVTSTSDKKTKQIIRHFKKLNPSAIIGLTGCFPQAYEDEATALTEVDIITGSYNRASLVEAVKKYLVSHTRIVDITPHKNDNKFEKMATDSFSERTRAFVKIQDGCNRFCSYCIIPTARGRVRSKALEDIKQELLALAKNGFKEVVLVGINLCSYGLDLGLKLTDAIKLSCSIDGIERVRLGSLEPDLLTPKDILLMAEQKKLCPHFHLSLQSGCDATLLRMNRHYTTNDYRNIVSQIRESFENPSITTDVMVGFPMETEQEFKQSLEFVREIGFSSAHVFSYSRRVGTKAYSMKGQILTSVKKERNKQMQQVTSQTKHNFYLSQLNTTQSVLFESKKNEDEFEGYTKNYTPVLVKSKNNLSSNIFNVIIKNIEKDHCVGEII